MSKPVEGGNTVSRLKQLVGGAQKYWNLPSSGSFLFSERNREKAEDAFHSSTSTLTERLRNQDSFSNLVTGFQKSASARLHHRGANNETSDVKASGHLDDFFEELATVLVHDRRATGKSTRSFNKEIEKVVATLAQSPIELDAHLPTCASSRDQMAKRKARIVAAKLKEEFSIIESPTSGSFSVPDMVESSESSVSRSSFTGNYTRSASRRKSIARARRMSNFVAGGDDDNATLDFSQASIGRRPSRTRPRKQSSRPRATRSDTIVGDKEDTEQPISPTSHGKASLHNKLRRRSIHVESSESSDESNKIRRRSIHVETSESSDEESSPTGRRRTRRPDLDLTVDSDCASFLVSNSSSQHEMTPEQSKKDEHCDSTKTNNPSPCLSPTAPKQTLTIAPQKVTTTDNSRKSLRQRKRGGLQRASPCRRRASTDERSHTSLLLPSRPRIESKRLSHSDHLPSSTKSLQDSGKPLKNIQDKTISRRKSTHASSIHRKSNNQAASDRDLHESAAWQEPVQFPVLIDGNHMFQSSTLLFQDELFTDAFFAERDQTFDTCLNVPRFLNLSKPGTATHSKNHTHGSNLTGSNITSGANSPVARRMMRRAQALSSNPLALYP